MFLFSALAWPKATQTCMLVHLLGVVGLALGRSSIALGATFETRVGAQIQSEATLSTYWGVWNGGVATVGRMLLGTVCACTRPWSSECQQSSRAAWAFDKQRLHWFDASYEVQLIWIVTKPIIYCLIITKPTIVTNDSDSYKTFAGKPNKTQTIDHVRYCMRFAWLHNHWNEWSEQPLHLHLQQGAYLHLLNLPLMVVARNM